MTKECKDRDIRISPTEGRVEVTFNGKTIASSTRALNLDEPGNPIRVYIPRADVTAEVLEPSDHHTHCPFKGDASYHSFKAGDIEAKNAAWYYPDPCPLVEKVRDHLCFWGDQITYVQTAV